MIDYDVEKVDPTQQNQTQLITSRGYNSRAIMSVMALVLFVCLCCSGWSWWSKSSDPEPPPTAVATTTANNATDSATPAPTDTPIPTPTETPLPCPVITCPSLIGLITYEYIVPAGMVITSADPRTFIQMPCKYSNIVLDTTGNRFYLILDRSYRFPGDPTARLGQFLVELSDLTGCHYPVAYLRDYYPFDQNVPDKPMTRVGEAYQEPSLGLSLQIPTPTPTPRRLFSDNPMAYNTPLATDTPTPVVLANVFGYLTAITDCLQSNVAVTTSSGELVVLFEPTTELPPSSGYNGPVTLIGQQTLICGRAGIKATKAIYQNTPTPAPTPIPEATKIKEPTRTATPSPTPQTVRLSGAIVKNVDGCTITDIGFSNRGDFYYLIFDSLADVPAGEATILGKLSNQCSNSILVSQITFSPTPTVTATLGMFDNIGLPDETPMP